MSAQVQLTIDDYPVTVPEGTTLFNAARLHGIPIPTLCHQQNETPVGVCRVCLVDVGARVLAASCVRPAENGMKVSTNSTKVRSARKTLVELLMADHPTPCARQQRSGDCELEALAALENVSQPRYPKRLSSRGQDNSSFVIAVDHEACILCDRCIRGCGEIRHNNVLARRGKGFAAGISFDDNQPMGNSSCVSCGECMISCPTGALTNRGVVETVLPKGEPVDVAQLLELPYFHNVSGTFLELNQKALVTRHFRAGEVICREGDYGSTAFYINEGRAQVFLSSPLAHVKTKKREGGLFGKLNSFLTRDATGSGQSVGTHNIPIEANVNLSTDQPLAELGPGDLFGEMTCMSLYPRSATVRALTDCTMLEMLRNVLDIIRRNQTMRARLEETYRRRALEDHLRGVPMFAGLSQDFIAELQEKLELVRFAAGDVIFKQGDAADAFYLVRIGFVKVTEEHPGGDLVLAYLGPGDYFGEIGLLGAGRRSATCSALDHVELVRMKAAEFHEILGLYPRIRSQISVLAEERIRQNQQRLTEAASTPLDTFLERGLMEAHSLLVLDLHKCTRCDECVRACADAHDGVTRLIREGMRLDHYLVATSCRHCRDPLCMIGCPVGSIRRRNSLEVVIEDWCIGCGLCANNCPYGNINMHSFNVMVDDPEAPHRQMAVVKRKATSCDLCLDYDEPSCVYACPHDAAHRVEAAQFLKDLKA